uniref:Exosome complex component RRP41 isoform X2 n=1 Tax=Rhizophora mucronata TaxID=61149 RepID=A0A2P2L8L0_RHIMU
MSNFVDICAPSKPLLFIWLYVVCRNQIYLYQCSNIGPSRCWNPHA